MKELEKELTELFREDLPIQEIAGEIRETVLCEFTAERVLRPALRGEAILENTQAIQDAALDEWTAAQLLRPALVAEGLTDALPSQAQEASLDELAAAQLAPALQESRLTNGLAESILQKIHQRALDSIRGIPNLEWIGTAFALGFALIVSIHRWDMLLELLRAGKWLQIIPTFAILFAAATLLFNASFVVRFDRNINRSLFGNRATTTIARWEMIIVQSFGMALIVTFCWMFFTITSATSHLAAL